MENMYYTFKKWVFSLTMLEYQKFAPHPQSNVANTLPHLWVFWV